MAAIEPLSDAKIIDSWRKNASPWTTAVQHDQIDSRRLVTNRAIVNAVLSLAPEAVLDIGCGEGWLARALHEEGPRVIGVDAVPELVVEASRRGGGDFRVVSYEEIAGGKLQVSVDLAVANFALIGKEAVDALIRQLPKLLAPNGYLVVQTLHPVVACGDQPYRDGWRAGTWTGFSTEFTDPAPWYFRTLESWVALFVTSGLRIVELLEPVHPVTGKPASVIFIAQVSG